MATTAYVTLNSRITTVEHGLEMSDRTIKDNASFVREWPLGLRGALPDKVQEIQELKREMRVMEIELGRLRSQTETQEEKIETLFELWNNQKIGI